MSRCRLPLQKQIFNAQRRVYADVSEPLLFRDLAGTELKLNVTTKDILYNITYNIFGTSNYEDRCTCTLKRKKFKQNGNAHLL